ncbi:MAG: hypothetical protein KC587_15875 [Nitrospira sp.]|nr:hypothetical protein [Nitrospira sp.]
MKPICACLLTLIAHLACSQPGSTKLDHLLRFVEQHAMHGDVYNSAPGENALVTKRMESTTGKLDSVHYYRVENGKSSFLTESVHFVQDTVLHRFSELQGAGYHEEVYSGETGKLLRINDQRGRTITQFFYDASWKLDSMVNPAGGSVYVEYDGLKEYWRLKTTGQLLFLQEFDADGHLTELRNYRGLSPDDSEWKQMNCYWEKDRLVRTTIFRVRAGVAKPKSENQFERDKNGIIKQVEVFEFTRDNKKFLVRGFGGPVKYTRSTNGEGQVVITRTYEGSPVTYTFDQHGNWISIVGEVVEEHRELFYKGE